MRGQYRAGMDRWRRASAVLCGTGFWLFMGNALGMRLSALVISAALLVGFLVAVLPSAD